MVTRIAFGGIPIQRLSRQEGVRLVRDTLELSVNFINTAHGYGHSEELIGEAIQAVPRDSVVVATKSPGSDARGLLADLGGKPSKASHRPRGYLPAPRGELPCGSSARRRGRLCEAEGGKPYLAGANPLLHAFDGAPGSKHCRHPPARMPHRELVDTPHGRCEAAEGSPRGPIEGPWRPLRTISWR